MPSWFARLSLAPSWVAAAVGAVAATLVAASPALAGFSNPIPGSLRQSWASPSEAEGAPSLHHHAAGLGFVQGTGLSLGTTVRLDEPDWEGLRFAAAARLGPLALGIGMVRTNAPDDSNLTNRASHRLDLALAFQLHRTLSVGYAMYELVDDGPAGQEGFRSMSVSLTWRPHWTTSVALAVDNVNRPSWRPGAGAAATRLEPVGRVEVGVRPGVETFAATLGAEATLADDPEVAANVGLRWMVAPGVTVGLYERTLGLQNLGGDGDLGFEVGALLGFTQGGLDAVAFGDVDLTTAGDDALVAARAGFELSWHSGNRASLVRPDVVVRFPVAGPIAERTTDTLLTSGPPPLAAYLAALDAYTRDPHVRGLVLELGGAPDWAQAWELRRALGRFKAAGKRVHAVLAKASMRELYLASVADQIHLHPSGQLFVQGLRIRKTYYTGLLDKIGVKAEIVKYADYKSLPERVTRTGPSEADLEQTRELLASYDAEWRRAVTEGRGVDEATLERWIAASPMGPEQAVEMGLVDALTHDDQLAEAVRNDPALARTRLVARWAPTQDAWRRWGGVGKRIVVIPIDGGIVDGRSGTDFTPLLGGDKVGDRSIVPVLEAASRDPSVVGIVVRVASGGGAVLASDRLHRAVQLASKRKPLVVSMGRAAASGGYYLAASAPHILAAPNTVTGSIGIIGGKVDLSGLYEMLGVTHHTERTAESADAMDDHRPWTEPERERAMARLKIYYDRFVGIVAEGRGLERAQAEALAGGRVYSGQRALELGLVDGLGGLWDAVEYLRDKAGVDDDEPVALVYAPEAGLFEGLARYVLGGLGLRTEGTVLEAPSLAARLVRALGELDGQTALARVPYELEVE